MIQVDESLDLGYINIQKSLVYVSLVPSSTSAIMVKYDPDIQISCVIPPKEFNIKFAGGNRHSSRGKKTLTVKTPTLIMSCGYGEVPTAQSYRQVNNGYTLWALDTNRSGKIYAKPYLLANVWDKGKICFGDLTPGSLRQAFNYYWTSSFNDELSGSVTHKCNKKAHDYRRHIGCSCDGSKKVHDCKCSRKTYHRHLGCGCTSVAESKKCRGKCADKDCLCCGAIKSAQVAAQGNHSTDTEKLSQRKLNVLAEMDNQPYPGCKCNWRHIRGCSCRKGLCNCPCECGCCKKTCQHPSCVCQCCSNKCGCKCNCTKTERLYSHMLHYNETALKKQPWKERTNFFTGSRFWSTNKTAEGVLICNNKELLKGIPKRFWRRDINNQPMIVALAKRNEKNDWYFESGGFSFVMSQENVVTR